MRRPELDFVGPGFANVDGLEVSACILEPSCRPCRASTLSDLSLLVLPTRFCTGYTIPVIGWTSFDVFLESVKELCIVALLSDPADDAIFGEQLSPRIQLKEEMEGLQKKKAAL